MERCKSTCLMARFNVGDRVKFSTSDGQYRTGTIFRLNPKTVSIKSDDRGHWNVSPEFLIAEKEHS